MWKIILLLWFLPIIKSKKICLLFRYWPQFWRTTKRYCRYHKRRVLMLMKTWKCKLLIIACLEQFSNSLKVTKQINLEKLEWDHCIVKLFGLKDINSLHIEDGGVAFHVSFSQLNLRTVFKRNNLFQNHTRIGKKSMTIFPLMKLSSITQLQWPVYWNLKRH